MSGAPFTEWSVVARRTSATSTPPSAIDPTMLDPFAMRPSSELWGGQGKVQPACQRGPSARRARAARA